MLQNCLKLETYNKIDKKYIYLIFRHIIKKLRVRVYNSEENEVVYNNFPPDKKHSTWVVAP